MKTCTCQKNLDAGRPAHEQRMPVKYAELAEIRSDVNASAAEMKSEMRKAMAESERWTIRALIGMVAMTAVGIIGVLGFLWNATKPSASASSAAFQPPIIINVPAAAQPSSPALNAKI